ncbi:MAG: dihydrodipicolinate synthase family protein [Candidatus Omnitrophica bacterium]|nr:dihydrodipicolinate synthase family protein [Candidatus Omnitrophota bacterium]
MEIVVPLLTPLDENHRLDETGLRNIIDFVLKHKVDGIFVLGTTGEFQFIKEKSRVIKIAIEQVAGRCSVFAGVTEFSVEETVFRALEAQNIQKAPNFLVIAPLVYHSNRKLFRHFERIEKFLQIPVYLYNNIGIVTRKLKRKDIIPGILKKLSEMEKIKGIKDSSGNQKYFKEVMFLRNENFKVLQGDEGLIMDSFLSGADGIVPSMANVFPEIFINLIDCLKSNKMEKARYIQKKIIGIRSIYNRYGVASAVLKEILKRKGIIKNSASFYRFDKLKDLTDQTEKKIEQTKKEMEYAQG